MESTLLFIPSESTPSVPRDDMGLIITTGVQRQLLSCRVQAQSSRYVDCPMPASHLYRGNGIRFTELSMLKGTSQAEGMGAP